MLKSHKEIFIYFDSARRQGFYFECVQLTIGWRCNVSKHMRDSILHIIKTKTNLRKARQIQSGLNHGGLMKRD